MTANWQLTNNVLVDLRTILQVSPTSERLVTGFANANDN